MAQDCTLGDPQSFVYRLDWASVCFGHPPHVVTPFVFLDDREGAVCGLSVDYNVFYVRIILPLYRLDTLLYVRGRVEARSHNGD